MEKDDKLNNKNYLMNSLLAMIMTLWIRHSVNLNQGYEDSWRTMWIIMITILLTHPIVSSINQENGKHPPSLTMMKIFLVHLLQISNMPTTIMWHLGQGIHPSSSAAPTEHYFVSLVTMILRRYWTRHAWISKICCYCKANIFPDDFGRCLRYSHTTH